MDRMENKTATTETAWQRFEYVYYSEGGMVTFFRSPFRPFMIITIIILVVNLCIYLIISTLIKLSCYQSLCKIIYMAVL